VLQFTVTTAAHGCMAAKIQNQSQAKKIESSNKQVLLLLLLLLLPA
jgi:hypothetical protein